MKVLSLFDGCSCGQVALKKAKIKVDKYYASEIDKYAIQVTQDKHPNTIQLGDINNWKDWTIKKPDIIIGGSPCQGFSFAGKQLNFDDERSKLFFTFVDILKHYKPKYFLLENVKMKKEFQDIISSHLGVEPIEIDSALVSAQNRKRLYWTNIPGIKQPKDKGILLKNIVHEYADEINSKPISEKEINSIIQKNYSKPKKTGAINTKNNSPQWSHDSGTTLIFERLAEYVVPFDKTLQILDKEIKKGKVGYFRKDSQANRVYYIHNKAVTLCGNAGGGAAKMGQYLFGCITPDRVNKKQNGQRFSEGRKFYTLTGQDRHGILIEGYIRKLTPVECERLQTLPDNYTEGVSNSQRYKMIGSGWTINVIAHIFKNLKSKDR